MTAEVSNRPSDGSVFDGHALKPHNSVPYAKMLQSFLMLMVSLLALCGCATANSEGDVETPVAIIGEKSIAEAEYSMSREERAAAIRSYQKMRAQILFELIINRTGEVVKVRVASSRQDDYTKSFFKSSMASVKFRNAAEDDPLPYRTFYFPLKLETSIEKY